MRAFILRRVELIARGLGDVVADRLDALRRHAARQGVPDAQRPSVPLHRSRSRRRRAGAARSLSRQRRPTCPVLICRGDAVLRNPTNQQIADCLGLQRRHRSDARPRPGRSSAPGPAGLAAAVYGASEGLDVLVLESNAPGRPGGIELANRELSRLSDRHLGPGAGRAAPTRRRRSSARRS